MKYFSIALHIFTGPRSFWGPSMGPSVSIIETLYDTFFNFVDVTLADDDTNSILTGDADGEKVTKGSARWCSRSYMEC